MADKKISELTALTTPDGAEELVVNDGGTSKKITIDNIFNQDIDVTGTITGDLTGDVTGDLTGDVTGDLTGESTLPAISTDITDTAVDVFVYDTRKDSDGGAWRKRTQHTSWYNETLSTATRGSRREFPAVAVIVAESDQVTIYDGDDPDLPMWMVFERGGNATSNYNWLCSSVSSPTSVAAKNGVLSVGSDGNETAYNGLSTADFKSDSGKAFRHSNAGGGKDFVGYLAQRNSGGGHGPNFAYPSIANQFVNDVAMTVLPNAPIDDATGLPVPTIAVATDGGVSVIKDDGSVVDITGQAAGVNRVSFNSDNEIWTTYQYINEGAVFDIPATDVTISAVKRRYIPNNNKPSITKDATGGGFTGVLDGIVGNLKGLSILHEDKITQTKGMVAYTTSTYNTGWMNGDIKLATLSDTDDTDVTGSELVTNGTFDSDLTGWSAGGSDAGAESVVSGAARLAGNEYIYQTITGLTAGQSYTLTANIVGTNSQSSLRIGTAANVGDLYDSPTQTAATTLTTTFVPSGTAVVVTLKAEATPGSTSLYVDWDNISVKLADADRSVNNNGLIVNGTVTRTPVATGAELVAYSGFSASNYLEQPYSSSLDFGTGDFCVKGWVKSNTNNHTIVGRGYHTGAVWSGPQIFIQVEGGVFVGKTSDDGFASIDVVSGTAPTDKWQHVAFVKSGSNTLFYVDGVLKGTTAVSSAAASLDNSNATLRLGLTQSGSGAFSGSLALLRISATAPTAEQIKKIYEDEKVLFQENAACTLYGSSDAVTALAHDSDTGLLHVGTSAGRSVFQGLRRVSNTTTAVGTAISASNSLVVEE